jgi:hypothetical protein
MPTVTAQVPVAHRVFIPNSGPGRHGSAQEGTLSDPIDRLAYQVYPARWQRPTADAMTIEEVASSTVELLMDVPDSGVYKKQDTVLIHGTSFVVQGYPDFESWGNGLQIMSKYDHLFGGQVLIKRVA